MKILAISTLVVLFSLSLCAQAPAPTPAPKSTPPAHHDMQHGKAMPVDHMQGMKGQVAKMRATLDKMKANLPNLKDPAVKQQAQLDVDMWEAMVEHMEGMEKMMSAHHGMRMGMSGGMGMGMMGGEHHGEHHHDMECKGDDCPKMPAPSTAPEKAEPPAK